MESLIRLCKKCKKPLLLLSEERKFHILQGNAVEFYHNSCLAKKEISEWRKTEKMNLRRPAQQQKGIGS